MDWHQTGTDIIVSVYAKKYVPCQSIIKLNPIRLTVDLYIVDVTSRYKLDIELKGVRINFSGLILSVWLMKLNGVYNVHFYPFLLDCRCRTK